jgi:hypothetical protein
LKNSDSILYYNQDPSCNNQDLNIAAAQGVADSFSRVSLVGKNGKN